MAGEYFSNYAAAQVGDHRAVASLSNKALRALEGGWQQNNLQAQFEGLGLNSEEARFFASSWTNPEPPTLQDFYEFRWGGGFAAEESGAAR